MKNVQVKLQYTDRNIEFFITYHGAKVIVHTASLDGMDMGDALGYIKQHKQIAQFEAMSIINVCAGLVRAA